MYSFYNNKISNYNRKQCSISHISSYKTTFYMSITERDRRNTILQTLTRTYTVP